MNNQTQIFVEDLEETILRLHVWFRELEEENDQFKKAKKFLGKIGVKRYSKDLQKEMRQYEKYLYYRGKFYAYHYVLESFGSSVAPVLTRLRGITSPKHNVLMETKAHYSEVKGHFDTDEFLKAKKVIK